MCGPSLFRAGAARLYFHPWKRAGSEDNLAGFVEHILSSRKQAVGQRYPICTAMDEFGIRRLCIIVVAVDLNQAGSCPHAIHIVIQASDLFHNPVLDFRVRIGVGAWARVQGQDQEWDPRPEDRSSYRLHQRCRRWQAANRWFC